MSGFKKLHMITFGCQMNVYDSERIEDQLRVHGFRRTDDPSQADLVVVNTCSVREKAHEKVFSALGRLRVMKEERPDMMIAVAGCVARQEGRQILRRAPYVDLILGPDHIFEIADLLTQRQQRDQAAIAVDFETDPSHIFPQALPPDVKRVSAFVTIMKGCSQFCSYCIVPYVRGAEISKEPEIIEAETAMLVDSGVREIILLGQNVNRYGKGQAGFPSFAALLRRIHEIPGLARLRFVTSHPADCSDELIECFRDCPKLASHVYLPMQSASDGILQAMNRPYTYAHYLDRVTRLRNARPEIALSSDFIVGFPGETEAQFQMTVDAVRHIGFSSAFSFKYSPRPGTAAWELGDPIPGEEKDRRLAVLQEAITSGMEQDLARLQGRTVEILVEGDAPWAGSEGRERLRGRTSSNVTVHADVSPGITVLPGEIRWVRIDEVISHGVRGELIDQEKSCP
jgi:tRNA-2-methylthio-N6-dimethylallyladenosine synthase